MSKYYAPKGEGMLPGDIVWDFVKKTGKKLDYSKGHVINEAMDGFKCKDCKYYMFSHRCLLLKGTLEPEMSCAFIVKPATGLRFNVDRDKLSYVIFNNATIKKQF